MAVPTFDGNPACPQAAIALPYGSASRDMEGS